MFPYERQAAVRRLLFDYVRSPSLRHLRDPGQIDRLAEAIVREIDREPAIWRKWEKEREELIRAAANCWVPILDLRAFLNELPGPRLTETDVAQRLRAIHEEPYSRHPDEALRESCLALYDREKAAGTELPAIIGALQEHVEVEGQRRRKEAEQRWRERREAERVGLEQRFLSGADCKWTPIRGSRELYTRKNGRAYRLAPTADKRWNLQRIEAVDDPGKLVGTYAARGDAGKALAKVAYEPEARW